MKYRSTLMADYPELGATKERVRRTRWNEERG